MTNRSIASMFSFCLLLLVGTVSFAQEAKKSRGCECGFGTINQAGTYVAGSEVPGGNFQTINGFRYREWFVGAGAAIDFYRFRTIPVFLDVRRTILNKPTAPFIYADFGVNYPWMRDSDKGPFLSQDFRSGYYFDFGAGYRFNLAKKHSLLLSAGYTEKRIREDRGRPDYSSSMFPYPTVVDNYKYTMKRIIVRVGWSLW